MFCTSISATLYTFRIFSGVTCTASTIVFVTNYVEDLVYHITDMNKPREGESKLLYNELSGKITQLSIDLEEVSIEISLVYLRSDED